MNDLAFVLAVPGTCLLVVIGAALFTAARSSLHIVRRSRSKP